LLSHYGAPLHSLPPLLSYQGLDGAPDRFLPSFSVQFFGAVARLSRINAIATKEINDSLAGRRAMQNLYELPLIENADIAEAAREALNRETSEDDTHPSPNDRFGSREG
jgi:hypothetical protein